MSDRRLVCPQYDQLVPRKKSKSVVWIHFGLPADNGGKILNESISICKHCKSPVSSKGGSTSNLLGHLKVYHPSHFKHLPSVKKSILSMRANELNIDTPRSSCILPACGYSQELTFKNHVPVHKRKKTMHNFEQLNEASSNDCTLSVTKFIATTMQPYNLVENQAFIQMLHVLNPQYKLPSKKYFSQDGIPNLYNDTVEKIKTELATVHNLDVSVTTECWTSVAGMPFIAITSHFINEEWEMKSFCLRCAHFEKDHTSFHIEEMLTDFLADWGLDVKNIASCTTDNGSNIAKAVHSLGLRHVPCFGHVINIGVNNALKLPQLKKAVSRLKQLQSTIARSWRMKRDFIKAQELLKMDVLSLPSACDTRWLSTYKLCSRFLENQLPLCKMLEDYPTKKDLMPKGEDVITLEHFVEITKVLKDITTTLSGEAYITASSILPLYRKIKKVLQVKGQDSSLMAQIKSEILSPLSEQYEKEPLISTLRMCSVCDPRFRLNFTDSAEDMKEIALNHLNDLYLIDYLVDEKPTTSQLKIAVPCKTGLSKLLDDDNDDEDPENPKPLKMAEIELQNYLSMPKVSLETNPLTWWKSHENSFPVLKTLARRFLAIQGTSVSSERIFSTSGNVETRQQASLLPKNAEIQIFLAQNKNII